MEVVTWPVSLQKRRIHTLWPAGLSATERRPVSIDNQLQDSASHERDDVNQSLYLLFELSYDHVHHAVRVTCALITPVVYAVFHASANTRCCKTCIVQSCLCAAYKPCSNLS